MVSTQPSEACKQYTRAVSQAQAFTRLDSMI